MNHWLSDWPEGSVQWLERLSSSQFAWTSQSLRASFPHGARRLFGSPQALVLLQHSGPQEWEIVLIAVRPERQGQGLARELLVALLNAISQSALIWLEVHADNHKAISLYEASGFVHAGRRRGYYQDGKDALVMRLDFTPVVEYS